MYLFSIFLTILLFANSAVLGDNSESGEVTYKNTILNVLIENIQKEKWENEDISCHNQIVSALLNAQNFTLWAVWLVDSIQLPTGALFGSRYQLGNYDQCLDAPWLRIRPELRTQYCLADVTLTALSGNTNRDFDPYASTEGYLQTKTRHNRKLNIITWGVCVPESCSPKATASVVRALLRSSSLGWFPDPEVRVGDCQRAGEEYQYGWGVPVFWYSLLALSVVAVASTWYLATNEDNQSKPSMIRKLAGCFCMNRNAYDLVKPSSEDILVLNGVRVLTAFLLALSHQIFFLNSFAINNGITAEKDIDRSAFMMHPDSLTDTFLFMSGLLLARSLVTKQELENPFSILWKRYVRLTVPVAFMVFYLAAVSVHMGSGPLWPVFGGREQATCAANWWTSLLMIGNYLKLNEMCFIPYWYIPADFHLTMLGLLLIYLCRGHRRMGVVAVVLATVLSFLPGLVTYQNNLPPTVLYDVETMTNLRESETFQSVYIPSQYRIGSYIVGLGFGYLFAHHKPALHRHIISKKLSIVAFIIAFTVGFSTFAWGGIYLIREYDRLEAALYAGTNRLVWAVALGAIVVIMEYGDLPIITGLMSWSAWVPLSRLSYGLYLTHIIIIQYNVYTARSPLREHIFTQFSDSFGPMVLGYLFSLVIWLLIQAPVSNLVTLLSPRRVQQKSADESKTTKQTEAVRENGANGKIKSL